MRAYVSNLRRVLEPDRPPRAPPALLRTSGTGYRLDAADDQVDALAFSAAAGGAVRAGQDGDWAVALAAAAGGLDRWRGPALVDVQSIPFAPGATARLDGQRARVELIRLRALVELGRPAEALGGLDARVAADPLDEAATALVMRALYLLGRPSDALARYAALSARLADQGLLPGPALRDLESAVLRHDVALDPPAAPAGPAPVRPRRPAAVVGRDEVWDALTEPARVLMTGTSPTPIGIGLGPGQARGGRATRARSSSSSGRRTAAGGSGYSGWSEPAWPVSCTTQNMAPAGSVMPAMRP